LRNATTPDSDDVGHRKAEIAQILTMGLQRLFERKSSQICPSQTKTALDFSVDESVISTGDNAETIE
jgi:hypothetical protein